MLITARLSRCFTYGWEALPLFMMRFWNITDDEKRDLVGGAKSIRRRLHFRPLPGGCRNCPEVGLLLFQYIRKPVIPSIEQFLVIRMYLPLPGYGSSGLGTAAAACCSSTLSESVDGTFFLLNLSCLFRGGTLALRSVCRSAVTDL